MKGYVIDLEGRSDVDLIRPANASSVNRSRMSPGRTDMTGAQPPNVHAYWSGVGTYRIALGASVAVISP
jgi:hypothetical protein